LIFWKKFRILETTEKEKAISGEMFERGNKAAAFKESREMDRRKQDSPATRERIKFDLLIHDLKVPLAVIEAGVMSLLNKTKSYGAITEKQEKVLKRVLRNAKITQTLVNDALELGRSREIGVQQKYHKISSLVERSLVELFDLTNCTASEKLKSCSDLVNLKQTLQENGIALFVDEGLWCEEVYVDEAKLSQILRNLLGNALKYRKSWVDLEVGKKEGCLVLSVRDDGEGIPSVLHEKIFESYFQAEVGQAGTVRGHGLGLAGVMVLVEDMGGSLHLESDSGKGAKFSVEIPVSAAE